VFQKWPPNRGASFPGTGPEHFASEVPPGLLHKVFETNFFAQVALTDALLPLIRKSAAMELSGGSKTSAALATLPDDGPTGG
jgi:hypothetical protein